MSSSITGLGANNAALQRALMDAAEKALAEDAETLAEMGGGRGAGAAAGARTAASGPRAAAQQAGQPRLPAEAIIVELSEQALAELETAPSTGPGQPADNPVPSQAGIPGKPPVPGQPAAPGQPGVPVPTPGTPPIGVPAQPAAVPGQPTPEAADAPRPETAAAPEGFVPQQAAAPARADVGARVRELPLDQLVSVLKGSGTGFKQAVKILGALQLDQPLPGRAVLKAMWDDAETVLRDPAAPETPTQTRARVAPDVMSAPLDQLVRDRAWHRADAASAPQSLDAATADTPRTAEAPRAAVPTLQTVVLDQPTNQLYVAGLTTAEYQRLVILLGEEVPAWFGAVRGARGMRGLMERRGFARLNTTRIAGMRLGGWALGLSGMGIAWVAGLRWGMWW